LSLESAILVALPATIVAVACGSSWSTGLRDVAHPARAILLVALCALAVVHAAGRRAALRPVTAPLLAAGALVAVAAVSSAWSVAPRHTVARAAGFFLVLLAAAALAAGVADDRRAARRLLASVLVGAVAVALVGLLVYAVWPNDAVQAATGQVGARFRGVGENPNTAAMLFAVTLPLAVLLGLEARSARGRLAAAAAFALLAGSLAMSGSRGALFGAVAGVLVFGLAAVVRPAGRLAAVAGAAVLGLAAVGLGSLPEPLSATEAAKLKSPSANTERRTPNDAEYSFRLEDELGYRSGYRPPASHSLIGGSGRREAWRGALRQGDARPVAGYGFGTEETVFVDRYADFQGGVPENSYLGAYLQLGAVGVLALLALLAGLAFTGVRLLARDRRLAAASLGVLGAGAVLALVQSYLYVAGNTATLALWACAFLPTVRAFE